MTGTFDKAPQVKIPKEAASGKLSITTPIKGSGPALTTGDDVLANVAIYVWSGKTSKLLQSTYTAVPQVLPANIGLTGLAKAIKGQTIGSRVLAVLPPKYGYGTSGNSQLGVSGKDTTVWVLDLIKSFTPTASATGKQVSGGGGSLPSVKAATGAAPTITIPKNTPPSKLVTKTLIQGSGPKLASNQTVVAQYVAVNWRTKQVFNSTWPSSQLGGHAVQLRPEPGRRGPRLRQGAGRGAGRQPGHAGHPALRGLRQDGQFPGRHQGDRHPGLRGRHPGGATGCRARNATPSAPPSRRTRRPAR